MTVYKRSFVVCRCKNHEPWKFHQNSQTFAGKMKAAGRRHANKSAPKGRNWCYFHEQWKSHQISQTFAVRKGLCWRKIHGSCTTLWGENQPQLSGASIWSGFYESLMHAKQSVVNIEFKNQLLILLHKFLDHLFVSHKNLTLNSARNLNFKCFARFRALKSIFEFNIFIEYFGRN